MNTENLPQAPTPTRAEEVAQGLEELAAWLRERPALPVEVAFAKVAHVYRSDKDNRAHFLAMANQLDNFTPRRGFHKDFCLEREFAGGVHISLSCDQGVFATQPPVAHPWPEEVRALAPDADWGDAS